MSIVNLRGNLTEVARCMQRVPPGDLMHTSINIEFGRGLLVSMMYAGVDSKLRGDELDMELDEVEFRIKLHIAIRRGEVRLRVPGDSLGRYSVVVYHVTQMWRGSILVFSHGSENGDSDTSEST